MRKFMLFSRILSCVFFVKKWEAEFKRSLMSLEDVPGGGQLKTTTTPETIKVGAIFVMPIKIGQQSKQWMEADGSVPKKAKSIASARKVMTSLFWDTREMMLL